MLLKNKNDVTLIDIDDNKKYIDASTYTKLNKDDNVYKYNYNSFYNCDDINQILENNYIPPQLYGSFNFINIMERIFIVSIVIILIIIIVKLLYKIKKSSINN